MTLDSDPRWVAGRTFDDEFVAFDVRVSEVTLKVSDWNPTGGTPVIMLHGVGVQRHTWDPIASVLAADRRVICPDLRGHGESGWTRSGYRVKAFAQDVLELAEALGLEQFAVVGHSLGARVALSMADLAGPRIQQVLLSDMGPEVSRAGAQRTSRIGGSRLARHGFRDYREALAYYSEIHPEWKPIFLDLHARYQLRENWAGMLVDRSDPDAYWLSRSPGAWDNDYLWDCCRRATSAILLLWGARSPYLDDAIVGRMRRETRHFQDLRLDCGHYIPREIPATFLAVLLAFLRGEWPVRGPAEAEKELGTESG